MLARVAQFGNAELIGRCLSANAKYCSETDSEQVQWWKDEKNFEKRVNKSLKLISGKGMWLAKDFVATEQQSNQVVSWLATSGLCSDSAKRISWGMSVVEFLAWMLDFEQSKAILSGWLLPARAPATSRFLSDALDKVITFYPSWNTDQGV